MGSVPGYLSPWRCADCCTGFEAKAVAREGVRGWWRPGLRRSWGAEHKLALMSSVRFIHLQIFPLH